MRILLLDIETSPNLAYVWGLKTDYISPSHLHSTSNTLCWAAKWHGSKEIMFDSVMQSTPRAMVRGIHKLLSEADAVVHYNGQRFDIPTLNKEFLLHNLAPPSEYKQIDLLKIARSRFRFTSNKLDYVAQQLGLGEKTKHPGHELWVKCMAKDPASWALMEKYNKNDVVLLESVYERFMPWIKLHPNRGTYDGTLICPKCGSDKYQARGYEITRSYRYKRFQCKSCGGWFRSHKSDGLQPKERFVNV